MRLHSSGEGKASWFSPNMIDRLYFPVSTRFTYDRLEGGPYLPIG